MTCRNGSRLLSALFDGEIDRSQERRALEEHVAHCCDCAGELRAHRRLSELLQVPEGVAEPDPGFVVRFRMLRDRERVIRLQPWRWLAVRLAPLAATTLLTAGLVIWITSDGGNAFSELEARELGNPQLTQEEALGEPVLRIAFGDL